jgi:hypothetical protein
VRERDLPGGQRVVVRHVRLRVTRPVLELDVHPHAELLDVERRCHPVDPEPLADPVRLFSTEAVLGGHWR